MRASFRVVRRLKLLVASWWALAVFAAEPTLQLTLQLPTNLSPWALVGVAAFLSAWGGASFTVQRWARGEENTRWKQFLVRDVFCAQTAGFGAFFACVYWKVDPPLAAIIVLVASYGGSRIIDKALSVFENAMEKKANLLETPKS